MFRLAFPDYVERFVDSLRGFLAELGVGLHEAQDVAVPRGRRYRLSRQDWETVLIIHHSACAGGQVGVYRARVAIELPPQLAVLIGDIVDETNRAASLGALIAHDRGVHVACQAVIHERTSVTTAGILAAAIVHAAPAMVHATGRVAGIDPARDVQPLSAWTERDFEQLCYDHAHLGAALLGKRGCSFSLAAGVLSLAAVSTNSYWGGGLMMRLRPDPHLFRDDALALTLNELNALATVIDDAPSFGAWCKREGEHCFVSFAPNFLKPLPSFTGFMIEAGIARLRAVPALVAPGRAIRPLAH